MKRLLMWLCCLLLPATVLAEALPVYPYAFSGEVVARYDTETLRYTVESFDYENATCYASKIWTAAPPRRCWCAAWARRR